MCGCRFPFDSRVLGGRLDDGLTWEGLVVWPYGGNCGIEGYLGRLMLLRLSVDWPCGSVCGI